MQAEWIRSHSTEGVALNLRIRRLQVIKCVWKKSKKHYILEVCMCVGIWLCVYASQMQFGTRSSVCPSGLRGHVQVVMYSYAWVQIPQPTFLFKLHYKLWIHTNLPNIISPSRAHLALRIPSAPHRICSTYILYIYAYLRHLTHRRVILSRIRLAPARQFATCSSSFDACG